MIGLLMWGCGGSGQNGAGQTGQSGSKAGMQENQKSGADGAASAAEAGKVSKQMTGSSRPASIRSERQAMSKTIQKGEKLRPFQARTWDGQEVDIEKLKGKYVLIDFWASWCGPCRAEIPYVKKLVEQYGSHEKFAIVGVSLDRSEAPMKDYISKNGMNWPNIYDGPGGQIASQYGVVSIPFTVLIGPDGNVIRTMLRGPAMLKEIENQLSRS